ERMEVVLGPGSALYGPNTADGVIHIITKSPLDRQGTSVSVGGGTQSVFQTTFRTAQKVSDNFGIKVSGQYFQAKEFDYLDPVELSERAKFHGDSAAFFRQQLMLASGLKGTEADKRIAGIGNRDNDVQRWAGEIRADWRPTPASSLVLEGGTTDVGKAIELTGLGAAQAKNWRYSYAQARYSWNRFFAQAYINASDAGDTYLLRNGVPITDKSKLYVAQIQHGLSLGTKESLTYGADFIYTNPITGGTINGVYEDDDQTTEIGGYLQSETALTKQLNLLLAGRVDHSTAIPDAVFSPRAGLVFKPTEAQAFRITYNRAFSTPTSLNQFLDLGSAFPDPRIGQLGYSLRIQGTGKTGFHYKQPNGGYLMVSPFTPTPGQKLPANASLMWKAAVQVAAQASAARGQPLPAPLVQYLASLTPSGTDIGTSWVNPAAQAAPAPISSLDLPDIPPIRESVSNTFEVGYQGVLGDKLLLAADGWYSKKERLTTALTLSAPLLFLNGQQTGAYLVPKLTQFFQAAGDPQPVALAKAQATAAQLAPGLAGIPLGAITTQEVDAQGAQLLTTYYNVDDNLKVYGADFAATLLLSPAVSLKGTLSLVNKDVFETGRGDQVTLNAPKTKGTLSVTYRSERYGFNGELRGRFNDSFPVRTGVYNGTLCLEGTQPAGAEKCVDSATLVDLDLGYTIPRTGATLQLAVQNVLDRDYRSFPGVPTTGRLALVRVKYGF
ncbi:MAG TPA: TonB-dependent receptor, partial [Longimicrobiales bacterium]|nr:TonB-dependent receptor [Longimicrobiales bacterium]